MEVFVDDFIVHGDSFDECLHHHTLVVLSVALRLIWCLILKSVISWWNMR